MDNRAGYREIKTFIVSNGRWNKIEIVIYRTDNYEKDQFLVRNFWIDKSTGERNVTRGIRVNEIDLKRLGEVLINIAEDQDRKYKKEQEEKKQKENSQEKTSE